MNEQLKNLSIIILLIFITAIFISCSNTSTRKKENDIQSETQPTLTSENCYGYIDTAFSKNNSRYLKIDTVQWLTGNAAIKAYKEDNRINKFKSTELPGGFYIRNDSKDSIIVQLSDSASVVMQTLSYNSTGNYNFNEKISAQKFFSILKQKKFVRFVHKLYKFKIIKNNIVSVSEKYIP